MARTKLEKALRPKHFKVGRLLTGSAAMLDKSNDDLAKIMKCSPSTVQRRMKCPGDLTLDELTALGRGLDISIDDLRQSIQY